MELREAPTFAGIAAADHGISAALMFAAIPFAFGSFVWATYAFGWAVPVRASISPPTVLEVALFAILASAPFLLAVLWWVRVTREVFRKGADALGSIDRVIEDRRIVDYSFSAGRKTVHRTVRCSGRRIQSLHPGMRVSISYDPGRPKRSFVRELYFPLAPKS